MSGLLPNLETCHGRVGLAENPCVSRSVFDSLTPNTKTNHSGPEEEQRQQSHSVRSSTEAHFFVSLDSDAGEIVWLEEESRSPVQVRDSMSLRPTTIPTTHALYREPPPAELRRQKEQCLNPAMLSFPTSSTASFLSLFPFSPRFSFFPSSSGLHSCARPSLIVASGAAL